LPETSLRGASGSGGFFWGRVGEKLKGDFFFFFFHQDIAPLLNASPKRTPHYADLEWRVDVELGSRMLRSQIVPTWLMKLSLEDSDGKVEERLLQTDATNLTHLYEELTMAFAEERTAYAKRIERNIK